LLSFGATVVVWVDGKSLLPITTVCLVYLSENPSIAVTPKSIIDESSNYFDTYRSKTPMLPDFGVWVETKQDSEV
jgi:hypothetical protein